MKKYVVTLALTCIAFSASIAAYDSKNSTITNKPLWEEKYSSVLSEYRNALGGQSGAGQLPDDVSYVLDTSNPDNVGYALLDLDDNGTPELITGTMDSERLYDIYTLDNDAVVQLKSSKLRSRVYVSDENRIIYTYMQEGISHTQLFDLDGAELTLYKELDSDYSDTYTLITDDGETKVTEEDDLFNEFLSECKIQMIEFTSFSEAS